MAASRSFGRGEGTALRRERSSHPAMNWLNTPLLIKTILDLGVLFVTVLLMMTVGMELEGRHFREVAANAFIISALVVGLAFARVLRLGASDSFTTGVLFAVRNVGLATAIAITLLGRLEYAVFAAVYFVTEVPLLFGAVALYGRWWARAPRMRRKRQPFRS